MMPKKDLDTHARFSQRVVAQLAEGPYNVPGFNQTCKLSSKAFKNHYKLLFCAPGKVGLGSCFSESVSFVGKCTLDHTDWPSLAF